MFTRTQFSQNLTITVKKSTSDLTYFNYFLLLKIDLQTSKAFISETGNEDMVCHATKREIWENMKKYAHKKEISSLVSICSKFHTIFNRKVKIFCKIAYIQQKLHFSQMSFLCKLRSWSKRNTNMLYVQNLLMNMMKYRELFYFRLSQF